LPTRLALVDLETTGMTATGDRITEVAIVSVENGVVTEEWSSLVHPGRSIPEAIQSLTGISNEMVRDAPRFSQIAGHVLARLQGCVFVAHNARFDYGFLKNEFRRLDLRFTGDVLCTVRLSRRLNPDVKGHSLDDLVRRHALPGAGRHRALGDARYVWEFLRAMLREHGEEEIEAAMMALLKVPSLPPQLDPGVFDAIPEGPGIYRFFGVNDLPLYIGKSVNLRDRVRSHFSSDHRSANDLRLSSEIRRLDYQETAGELGALLLEARLVKEATPLSNTALRRKGTTCVLRLPDLSAPPEILDVGEVEWEGRDDESEALYGPFASKRHARQLLERLASEEGLCWRQLGWEKRGGPCFARQLKRCRGACVGEESPEQHHLRLATALAPWRIGDWPWRGPVGVREIHPDGEREEIHVIDRWRHIGTARDEEELAALAGSTRLPAFDPDILKLLVRWFAAHPRSVKPLAAGSESGGDFDP
jgi:DNA polymerase-3 subunit epsilon